MCVATMAAAYADNLYRHRLLTVTEDGLIQSGELRVMTYQSKPTLKGLVYAGPIIFDTSFLMRAGVLDGADWSSIIEPLIARRHIRACIFPEAHYFNVGTVPELREAERHFDLQSSRSHF
jgi:hypothetical protein